MGENMTDELKSASGYDEMPQDETARPKRAEARWMPNKVRKVKSKKSYDQKKMAMLVDDNKSVYRGELDPRQKDPERKPRSISRSEELVMRKAEKLAENDPSLKDRNVVRITDFRDQFERNDASPGRLAALYATNLVRRRGAFAQEVIESTIDRSTLSAQDRAFATLLTLGVVSTSGALDIILNRCLASPRDIQPDVRDAMRISAYEIIYLRKAPHAALDRASNWYGLSRRRHRALPTPFSTAYWQQPIRSRSATPRRASRRSR